MSGILNTGHLSSSHWTGMGFVVSQTDKKISRWNPSFVRDPYSHVPITSLLWPEIKAIFQFSKMSLFNFLSRGSFGYSQHPSFSRTPLICTTRWNVPVGDGRTSELPGPRTQWFRAQKEWFVLQSQLGWAPWDLQVFLMISNDLHRVSKKGPWKTGGTYWNFNRVIAFENRNLHIQFVNPHKLNKSPIR